MISAMFTTNERFREALTGWDDEQYEPKRDLALAHQLIEKEDFEPSLMTQVELEEIVFSKDSALLEKLIMRKEVAAILLTTDERTPSMSYMKKQSIAANLLNAALKNKDQDMVALLMGFMAKHNVKIDLSTMISRLRGGIAELDLYAQSAQQHPGMAQPQEEDRNEALVIRRLEKNLEEAIRQKVESEDSSVLLPGPGPEKAKKPSL